MGPSFSDPERRPRFHIDGRPRLEIEEVALSTRLNMYWMLCPIPLRSPRVCLGFGVGRITQTSRPCPAMSGSSIPETSPGGDSQSVGMAFTMRPAAVALPPPA